MSSFKIKESTAKALSRGELKHALALPKVVREVCDSVAGHVHAFASRGYCICYRLQFPVSSMLSVDVNI